MNVLVTGATGYIGSAVAADMKSNGHSVAGLARSDSASAQLRSVGVEPVFGDFRELESLRLACEGADIIVSTASLGAVDATPQAFANDREAVRRMLSRLEGTGKTFIFTSGSAIVGVLGDGEASEVEFDEDVELPLAEEVFAPSSANLPPPLVDTFATAMNEENAPQGNNASRCISGIACQIVPDRRTFQGRYRH